MADADLTAGTTVPERLADQPAPPTPPSPGAAPGGEKVMSLVDHLAELRTRLFRAILAVALGSVVGWIFAPQLITFLRAPIGDRELIFLSPGEAFFVYLKISVAVGIILAMPVILYQVWSFVAPGLTPSERRAVRPWVPLALVFFALGVGVAYVILPFAMTFLLSFEVPGVTTATLTMDNYFGFVTTLFLAFGVTMEFPILLFGLSRVGILTSSRLKAWRRFVILGVAIFAAVVTPGGDPISPLVLGVTMYTLFEGTVFVIARTGH